MEQTMHEHGQSIGIPAKPSNISATKVQLNSEGPVQI